MQTYYYTEKALGTTIHMALVSDASAERVHALLRSFWLDILMFEKRCSRFLLHSELSQFNRAAGSRQVVSPEFYQVLVAAKTMGEQTGGLFNPFVLPSLQRVGYRQSLVPEHTGDPTDDHSGKRLVAVEMLTLGDGWASIPYGTAIDLGGCGKGFLGDWLADKASRYPELAGYWFSLGGDVVMAGHDEQVQPWVVYITPHITDISSEARIGCAKSPDGRKFAVATSTVKYRTGIQNGKAWHHIIDPRTGQPAHTNIQLASVSGSSLLQADVLASCVIIQSYPAGAQLIRQSTALTGGLLQITQPGPSGQTEPTIICVGRSIRRYRGQVQA